MKKTKDCIWGMMTRTMKLMKLASQKFEERYSRDGELLQHENLVASPKGEEDVYGDPVKEVSRDANL